MYERLKLMHQFLVDDGSIYVHCDWRVNSHLKLLLDDIFGKDNFRNEVYCQRIRKNVQEYETVKKLNVALDIILIYGKSESYRMIAPRSEIVLNERWHAFDAPGIRNGMDYELFGIKPPRNRHWMWEKSKTEEAIKKGKLRSNSKTGKPEYKVESDNPIVTTLWDDIPAYSFQYGYATEKSEKLLTRIIEASSNEGDLVADLFCGSGTTPAVAEKNNRKWIACDLGRFAVHTTRKRLIGIQRELKESGNDFRAFEVLNLGKYERQFFMTKFTDNPRQREQAYISLILEAYKAQPVENHRTIHGKKANRMIHVGSLDVPVTKTRVEDIFEECKEKLYTSVDVLGFEFEMGLMPYMQQELKEQGVDIRLRYIPKEVFDRRVVDKGQARFYDVSYLSAKATQTDKKTVTVTLTDFITNYTQDDIEDIEQSMRSGSKVVIENGQIVKLSKDKDAL